MADIAELLVNAVSGLGGALLGGFFTLYSAKKEHERARKASAEDEAKAERARDTARCWQIIHNIQLATGCLRGMRRNLTNILKERGAPDEPNYWRVLQAPVMSSDVPKFSADELALFVVRKRGDLISKALDLQSMAASNMEVMRTYGQYRETLIADHRTLIQVSTTEELFNMDPRFIGLSNMAIHMVRDIVRDEASATTIAEEIFRALENDYRAMGLNIVKALPFEQQPENNS